MQRTLHMRTSRFALSPSAIALVMSLAACERQRSEPTVGQRVDNAVATVEQKAKEVKSDIKDASSEIKAAAEQAGTEVKQAAVEAGDKMKVLASDSATTAEVNAKLARDSELSALSINVNTTDGRVVLNGSAPTASSRDRAKTVAEAVQGVKSVENRLTVK